MGRQQDASLLVRFYCHRVAEEVPLHAASAAHGQLVDLLLQLVPFLSGIHRNTFIQPYGQNKIFAQLFPELGGEIDPVFRVNAVLVLSHQHLGSFPPFRFDMMAKQGRYSTPTHFSPLTS